ncbi:MAG: glycosyltransferase family 4 protein [Candidatus Helarchaeota archaeon]|nr:glycosyltransferase family 4 protein [Candidatus Helarchaeota archaeon]
MHILCVGGFNYPGYFGDSSRIPILARYLRKKGVRVSFLLLTYPRKGKFQGKEIIDQIEIYRLFPYIYHEKLSSQLVRLLKPLDIMHNPFRMIRKLHQLIKIENFDLVLGFMPRFTGGVPASLCKKYKIPFLLDVSDFEYYTPFWRIFRRIDRLALFKADLITVINRFVKSYITELGVSSNRIKYIPNGINFQLFNPKVKGNEIRQKYDDRPIILHVGAFYSLNLVMDAMPLIVDENPDVLFLFVGPRNRDYYENLVSKTKYKDNFTFIESVPHERVPEYIAATDICILTFKKSKYTDYSQPFKILEYLACGKPIISTDLLGVRDIVKSSDLTEYLVRDPTSFAKKINQLLADKSLREQLGKIGYEIVKIKYDWEKITSKFMMLCEKLIK